MANHLADDRTDEVAFSVNFDYRCPFARNANEHIVTALLAGAPYDVTFLGFSLSQMHIEEGDTSVWERPEKRNELTAVAAGIAVRDRDPEHFLATHIELFRARHDLGEDLRDDEVIKNALRRGGSDPEAVYAELVTGRPYATLRAEHEQAVRDFSAFGVPTFIYGDEAAFVRVMTRPDGDGKLAIKTIDRIVDLLVEAPELNEFKHTTVSN